MHRLYESNQNFQQIYSKAESSSFLTLYRQIIKQITFEKIQHINTIWLSEIAQIQAAKYSQSISSIIIYALKENPKTIYRYFNNGLISQSEVERIQSECVRNATHEEDFVRAIYYLANSSLKYEAYNWLLGKNLSSNTLRKLGITANIDNPELAKISLRFLATFFAQAHQPLFLYIDRIEYLLLNTSTEERFANIGELQSLAEIYARKNCFLCLSGLTKAWNILPENLFTRILPLEIPSLSWDETLNLMKIYLAPSDEFTSYASEEDIYPYTEASIREMLRLSHGNIARTLHLAYETFEKAAPNQTRIEVEQVKEAALSFNKNMTHPLTISKANSNLTSENQKLLFEAYIKLLDTIAGAAEPRAKIARQVGEHYLVYVHGISQHRHGYSNGWWNVLKGFVGDIFGNGDLGGTRQEVLWSDLVNPRALVDQSQQQQLRREIELALKERQTQMIAATTGGGNDARRATIGSSAERVGSFAIDDFLIYMLNSKVRQQIIDRFTGAVKPLLENGSQLDIISHSWGTVVAYEGLRELEKLSLPGRVTTWFTVGSALSISPVRDRLRAENQDGNRPTNVEQWLNLDARGDLVGGMLGDKFDVTQEYLNLEPTGCSRFLGIYNPGCAHNSYFSQSNTAVNRDIFAQYITS